MDNTDRPRKIGILGGTFNPIHIGHLLLAQNAMEYCDLDEVLIMPSGVSYLKDPDEIAATRHRVNMVKHAIEGNDGFVLSTIESERKGNSYTYETLGELVKEHPDVSYHYIIGADTLFSIENWKNPDRIFDKCTIVCARRDGHSDRSLNEQRAYLEEKFNAHIIIMDVPETEISSSFIRNMLAMNKSCRYYLDDKVREYIKVNGLYGFDSNR